MSKYVAVELGCKECGKKFIFEVDNEIYDNDYSILCKLCGKEQKLSYYDYFVIN
jgi:DNA-directed RNA polymerase subunit RPC12/RpoP